MTRAVAAAVSHKPRATARLLSLAVLCASCLAWRDSAALQDPRAHVRALLDAGKYAEAEAAARVGGAALSVALGDVLVARGKLTEAEATYVRAITTGGAERWAAEVALAELSERRGEHARAEQRATTVVNAYRSMSQPNGTAHIAAGRAYVLLMRSDRAAAQRALSAFDAATELDSTNLEAQRRAGDLLLARSGDKDATTSYQAVLRRAPKDAHALLGMARVTEFQQEKNPLPLVEQSLAANPQFPDALVMRARMYLAAEAFDSARALAGRAIATDSSSLGAWGLLGAVAWLRGDSAVYRRALASATMLQPKPVDFHTTLAEAATRQRRYADAYRLSQLAVSLDSASVRALNVLGATQLQLGQMEAGRATLARSFALDGSGARTKNTLDLLDQMQTFTSIDTGHFRFVAPTEEAALLSLYIVPLLERAFDTLSVRYGYKPATPVRLEFFRRSADFSVRAIGESGLGALGVSFGNVLAMDAPSARERGTFNWGSTAWHELTHAFTLGASDHRVPRWLSEGLSVFEERRAAPGWGASATTAFVGALGANALRPMSELSEGFMHPRFPEETQFSYYQASLFCEMVVELKGLRALPAMLTAYRDGYDTPAVFQRVLGMTSAQVDAQFDRYMRTMFATALTAIAPKDSSAARGATLMSTMQRAVALLQAGRKDSARVLLEQAQRMFPQYAGSDGPSWYLTLLARDRGDTASALRQVSEVTSRNEVAWEANVLQADLSEKRGDTIGATAALERLFWMHPYDPAQHARVATMASVRGDHLRALRERRAIIALRPADLLDARYELAKALAASGDARGARRELLEVLEQAPSFEKAQALLLALRAKSSPGAAP